METNEKSLEVLKKIKEALFSIGFSEEEASKQITDLTEILIATAAPKINSLSENEKTPEKVGNIFGQTSIPIISNYFIEISKSLNDADREKFWSTLNEIR